MQGVLSQRRAGAAAREDARGAERQHHALLEQQPEQRRELDALKEAWGWFREAKQSERDVVFWTKETKVLTPVKILHVPIVSWAQARVLKDRQETRTPRGCALIHMGGLVRSLTTLLHTHTQHSRLPVPSRRNTSAREGEEGAG